jgi:hypothetical protein
MKSFHGLLDGSMAYFYLNGDFCTNRHQYYVFVTLSGCEYQLGRGGNLLYSEGRVDRAGLIVTVEDFQSAVAAWSASRRKIKA